MWACTGLLAFSIYDVGEGRDKIQERKQAKPRDQAFCGAYRKLDPLSCQSLAADILVNPSIPS